MLEFAATNSHLAIYNSQFNLSQTVFASHIIKKQILFTSCCSSRSGLEEIYLLLPLTSVSNGIIAQVGRNHVRLKTLNRT